VHGVAPYTLDPVRSPLRRVGAVIAFTVAAVGLVACDDGDGGPASSNAAEAAEKGRVGAAGSACELPVSFGIAESWEAEAVAIEADDPFAELARQGPLTMACEIDAKPAGAIGFLRVWTGAGGDLRAILGEFIGDRAEQAVFRELRFGDRAGLEVVYQKKSQLDDELEPEQAFVVPTGAGVAAVSLDSFDSGEHADMLPAYELAKASLTVTG
jgi:hypothetical protein